uniref:G-protein coupled receptors family 1 profile domain-containing protein n=1 Tax=Capra hircus TaxID=9925 RepID=A0A452EFY2_CAPHI
MAKENMTLVTEFVLTGLTDLPGLQVPLFLVFLVIYLTTMVGNLGLIFLIWKDPHLHTPMYSFLGSLAFADACCSSSVTPKMLTNFLSKNHVISELKAAGISSVQLSPSVVSDSLRPHESQHARPPCPSPTPGVHSDSHPSSQ